MVAAARRAAHAQDHLPAATALLAAFSWWDRTWSLRDPSVRGMPVSSTFHHLPVPHSPTCFLPYFGRDPLSASASWPGVVLVFIYRYYTSASERFGPSADAAQARA